MKHCVIGIEPGSSGTVPYRSYHSTTHPLSIGRCQKTLYKRQAISYFISFSSHRPKVDEVGEVQHNCRPAPLPPTHCTTEYRVYSTPSTIFPAFSDSCSCCPCFFVFVLLCDVDILCCPGLSRPVLYLSCPAMSCAASPCAVAPCPVSPALPFFPRALLNHALVYHACASLPRSPLHWSILTLSTLVLA